MKKALICLIMILVVASMFLVMLVSTNYKQFTQQEQRNKTYEEYLNKELLGTDVTTAINKAMNANVKNEVPKDEKGFFIENDTNSIKIEIIMFNEEEPVTYQMETIQKVGMNRFIDNFNIVSFKCSKIEYHKKTKQVKKIVFEQIEE